MADGIAGLHGAQLAVIGRHQVRPYRAAALAEASGQGLYIQLCLAGQDLLRVPFSGRREGRVISGLTVSPGLIVKLASAVSSNTSAYTRWAPL